MLQTDADRDAVPSKVTVIPLQLEGDAGDPQHVIDAIEHFLAEDDVFSLTWLETIFLISETPESAFVQQSTTPWPRHTLEILHDRYGVRKIVSPAGLPLISDQKIIAHSALEEVQEVLHDLRGPYLFRQRPQSSHFDFLAVYRLHPDTYRTFVVGVYPTSVGHYNEFRMVDSNGYSLIPLPARLYARCEDNGVCSKRIGVKGMAE